MLQLYHLELLPYIQTEKASVPAVNTNKCPTPKGIITVSLEERRKTELRFIGNPITAAVSCQIKLRRVAPNTENSGFLTLASRKNPNMYQHFGRNKNADKL